MERFGQILSARAKDNLAASPQNIDLSRVD
jgi:hypothetical protein